MEYRPLAGMGLVLRLSDAQMKLIPIKSQSQREMLERCAGDAKEAAMRGMTCAQARASLDAHGGGRLPHRLGPERPNRHGARP